MTASVLKLSESCITAIDRDGDALRVTFEPAVVIRSEGIPLADASTEWRQHATCMLSEVEITGELPVLPITLTGGSIQARGYKTIDMIQLPLDEDMFASLQLTFGDSGSVQLDCEGIKLDMLGDAKYVQHLEAG